MLNSASIFTGKKSQWSAYDKLGDALCVQTLTIHPISELWIRTEALGSADPRDLKPLSKQTWGELLGQRDKHGTSKGTCVEFYCPLKDTSFP